MWAIFLRFNCYKFSKNLVSHSGVIAPPPLPEISRRTRRNQYRRYGDTLPLPKYRLKYRRYLHIGNIWPLYIEIGNIGCISPIYLQFGNISPYQQKNRAIFIAITQTVFRSCQIPKCNLHAHSTIDRSKMLGNSQSQLKKSSKKPRNLFGFYLISEDNLFNEELKIFELIFLSS